MALRCLDASSTRLLWPQLIDERARFDQIRGTESALARQERREHDDNHQWRRQADFRADDVERAARGA